MYLRTGVSVLLLHGCWSHLCHASSLVKRAAYGGGKPSFRVVPIVVVLIVLCLAVASHLWFVDVASNYPDGTTAATERL